MPPPAGRFDPQTPPRSANDGLVVHPASPEASIRFVRPSNQSIPPPPAAPPAVPMPPPRFAPVMLGFISSSPKPPRPCAAPSAVPPRYPPPQTVPAILRTSPQSQV